VVLPSNSDFSADGVLRSRQRNYDFRFERGAIDSRILIDGEGKIAGEALQSIP
jgi:hypothetical protein